MRRLAEPVQKSFDSITCEENFEVVSALLGTLKRRCRTEAARLRMSLGLMRSTPDRAA